MVRVTTTEGENTEKERSMDYAPITKDQAINVGYFHNNTERNADSTCVRYRRNGSTQTWKTRPDEWRIPVKYGLKGAFSLRQYDAGQVHAAEDCQRV